MKMIFIPPNLIFNGIQMSLTCCQLCLPVCNFTLQMTWKKKMILRYYIHTKTQTYMYKLLSDQKKYMEKQESSGGWKFLMHTHLNRKRCNSTIHVKQMHILEKQCKKMLTLFLLQHFCWDTWVCGSQKNSIVCQILDPLQQWKLLYNFLEGYWTALLHELYGYSEKYNCLIIPIENPP